MTAPQNELDKVLEVGQIVRVTIEGADRPNQYHTVSKPGRTLYDLLESVATWENKPVIGYSLLSGCVGGMQEER